GKLDCTADASSSAVPVCSVDKQWVKAVVQPGFIATIGAPHDPESTSHDLNVYDANGDCVGGQEGGCTNGQDDSGHGIVSVFNGSSQDKSFLVQLPGRTDQASLSTTYLPWSDGPSCYELDPYRSPCSGITPSGYL